jgi:hypothetical protein
MPNTGYIPQLITPFKLAAVSITTNPQTLIDPVANQATSELAGKDVIFRVERLMMKFSASVTLNTTNYISLILLDQTSNPVKEYELNRIDFGGPTTTVVLNDVDAGGNFSIGEEVKLKVTGANFVGKTVDIQLDKAIDL